MDAFLFYIDDWLSSKSIAMMDALEERGYLRLLLAEAKEPDCGLPDDDKQLAVFSMLNRQWFRPTREKSKRIEGMTSGQKIRQCFARKGGRLFNERLLREWRHQQEVRQSRRDAGRRGGRPRKQKVSAEETNSLANDKANGKQTTKQNESKTKQTIGLGLGFPGESSGEANLYEFFCEAYAGVGTVPEDLWQDFPGYVTGASELLQENLADWIRAYKVSGRFAPGARKFLMDKAWKRKPPAAWLQRPGAGAMDGVD